MCEFYHKYFVGFFQTLRGGRASLTQNGICFGLTTYSNYVQTNIFDSTCLSKIYQNFLHQQKTIVKYN